MDVAHSPLCTSSETDLQSMNCCERREVCVPNTVKSETVMCPRLIIVIDPSYRIVYAAAAFEGVSSSFVESMSFLEDTVFAA